MASGSASYSVSATNYGRNPADAYYSLALADTHVGPYTITGDLTVDGTSDLVGAVTMGGQLNVAGSVVSAGITTGGITANGAITASGAVSAPSVASAGAVTAASVAATGAVTAASVAATGAVTAASVAATGAVSGASLAITGSATVGGLSAPFTGTLAAPLASSGATMGQQGFCTLTLSGLSPKQFVGQFLIPQSYLNALCFIQQRDGAITQTASPRIVTETLATTPPTYRANVITFSDDTGSSVFAYMWVLPSA